MMIPAIVWTIFFYSFCVAILTQLLFYLFFFRRLAFYKEPEKKASIHHPVSVVICAKNEAEKIANNLPGVLLQQYKSTYEIVVVNDNSEDETKYLLDEFKKTFKNLTVIELVQEGKLIAGKKFPLSMGIRSTKYEALLLTDADCMPASEHWIDLMQQGYSEDTEIVLGYGAYHKQSGLLNKLVRFETYHTALQYLSFALAGKPYMGVGRNLSYKKDVFIKNKGFSAINNIPGGDDDLFINKVANKNNTSIVIAEDAHTRSSPPKTFNAWTRQKFRHYTTSKYYKSGIKFLLSAYTNSHFWIYPLLAVNLFHRYWWMALILFGIRLIPQAIIHYKAMKKLNESDLFPWLLFLDIWMFFYYIFFFPALWRKPKATWK